MSDVAEVAAGLEQAARARAEHADLTTRLEGARGYLAAAQERVDELRRKLAAENEDVDRLESFSPTRIWAALRRSRATDLEREKAERESARFAVAEAQARHDAAERDVTSLEGQRDALGDVEALHARALAAKEEWVAANDPGTAALIEAVATERGALLARDREAREAHAAGAEALTLLGHARQLLGSAESWSTWDTFGGGMLADMAKYDKMDRATEMLRRADIALGRFSRELADVGLAAVGGIALDPMTRTFDLFFDNIFTDMAVRNRIQDAARRADAAAHAVQQAMARLEATGREIAGQLTELDARREALLAG